MQTPRPLGRPAGFFFMHLGTLVGFAFYVVLGERAGWTVEGVTRALWTGLAMHSAYIAIAAWQHELKQFDVGIWLMLAVGALAGATGAMSVLALYQRYAGALLFSTLALTTVVPLVLGRAPFTTYHAVRQTPRWQHRTPAFAVLNRVMAWFWALIFVAAATLCAARPTDPTFTFVYPNLLVFLVGFPAAFWLPPLWLRVFPAALPDAAEPLIMGMPYAFDAGRAAGARAVIQFRVSGSDPGDYWVRIADGRCESFEGMATGPADLTVHTPDHVWVAITHGRLDGTHALMERSYAVEGDALLLTKLQEWFRLRET